MRADINYIIPSFEEWIAGFDGNTVTYKGLEYVTTTGADPAINML